MGTGLTYLKNKKKRLYRENGRRDIRAGLGPDHEKPCELQSRVRMWFSECNLKPLNNFKKGIEVIWKLMIPFLKDQCGF